MTAGGSGSSPLLQRARELAGRAHAGQLRKSGGVPYVTHLDAVAKILRDHGHDDEITLAAALLHDLVEDQPDHAEEFRRTMPPEVVDTVLVLTETKLDASGRKKPKSERFDGYVRNLSASSEAALRARPISCADKIHNLGSVVQAEADGEGILMRLTTRPGEQLAQVARLRPLYEGVVSSSLLAAYDAGVEATKGTIRAWLPGRAALIMAEAHLGQFDRAGKPYVLHPMHLGLQAKTAEETMVAFLHDVVEDGDWDLRALEREGFPEAVLRAVDAVTRRADEDYEAFIERIARDRLATRVKLLDLAHNSDLARLPAPTDVDRERAAKYQRAAARLERELEKKNLYVRLDAESRASALSYAALPVHKAEHVTLARRVIPRDVRAEWIPGGAPEGGSVELRAVAVAADARVQAFVIEMGGSTVRPFDGGTLHLTVSRAHGARSRDSNDVLEGAPRTPIDMPLRGFIEWVDE